MPNGVFVVLSIFIYLTINVILFVEIVKEIYIRKTGKEFKGKIVEAEFCRSKRWYTTSFKVKAEVEEFKAKFYCPLPSLDILRLKRGMVVKIICIPQKSKVVRAYLSGKIKHGLSIISSFTALIALSLFFWGWVWLR